MLPDDLPILSDADYAISPNSPDAYEQLMVELINRARMDPMAEATRQGTSLGDGVSPTPSQPLAVSPELDLAASLHSADMIARDYFAHTNLDGVSPFTRMRDAGYDYMRAGENIGIIWSTSDPYTQSRVIAHHNNLWNSLGHRVNLMNGSYSEIGAGYETGSYVYSGYNYTGTSVITQNFGDRGYTFLTGVVIDDLDGDEFYDIGEGQGGVRITAYNDSVAVGTTTWDAGGYTLQLDPGTYTVVFDGGDLDGHYVTTVTIGDSNVKLDVIEDRDAIPDTEPTPEPDPEPLPPDPEPDPEPEPEPEPESNFTIVMGDGGRDGLSGTDADEVFISGGGRTDRIETGGGADIIFIGDETSNGRRERDVVYDFDPELDSVALDDGISVIDSYQNRRGHLVLEFSGGDGDELLIRTDMTFDELNIINGTSDFLV